MECRHIFPNGQRCRCLATATHVYCRRHAPQPRVPTQRNRATPFTRWIDLRRNLPNLDRNEIPPTILWVLNLLLQEGPRTISDVNAGILLRYLLRTYGSVPFGLPDDPPPEPDPTLLFSQSLDRLMEILRRHCTCGPLLDRNGRPKMGMDPALTKEVSRIVETARVLPTPAE